VGQTLGRAVRAAVQQTVVIQGWQSDSEGLDADASDDLASVDDASAQPADDAMPSPLQVDDRRDADEARVQAPPYTEDDRVLSTQVDDRRDANEARFQAPAQPNAGYRPPFVRDMSLFTRPPQPAPPEGEQPPAARQPIAPTPVQAALLDHEQPYPQPELQRAPQQVAETRWPEPPVDHATDDDARAADVRADLPLAPPAAQPDATQPAMHLPPLRALAQLAQTYLLTEGPNGALFLIDQHAAHERITYERLLAQHAAGLLQSQTLLLPQYVALPPSAQQALLGAADELADWGFVLAEADGGVDVQAVPADLALEALATTLPDLASHLGGSAGHGPNARRDAMLATLACHTSVRAGQTLTAIEQQALIDQLAGCEGPRTCPHGRPTLIVLTKHQLEHQFGRLGA
jgi:DNA mismatch repair ATPase MutL